MFFSARNAKPSPARSALIKGAAVVCLMLAALGVFELATGHAEVGILGAVFIEIALALALLIVRFKELVNRSAITGSENSFTKTRG